MNKAFIRISVMLLAVLLAVPAYAVDAGKDKDEKARPKDNLYGQVELFADSISILRSDYVEEVDSKKLIYGAMKGMLSSLDDYSQFLEPEEFNEMKVETKGEFGGIGIEISMKDGILAVITPIMGTPADTAGVKAGDKIVRIDGKTTKDLTLNDAVKKMRGKPGTTVTLTVWREKEEKVLDIPIKRDTIKIRSIKRSMLLDDKIGYVRLVEFNENAATDLEDALKKLEGEGMDALILDLRNNPGGLLDVAVEASQRFLAKDKVIVSIKSRNPKQEAVYRSSGKFTRKEYPLIVMVNEGSASGSEILAGAVQDNKRGLVLGEKTFGKASVQTVIPLKDGSAIRFTTASYLTPSGKMIRGQGIQPDVVVEWKEVREKEKDKAKEIFDKVESKPDPKQKDKKEDPKDILERDNQLQAALNLMKAIKIYRSAEAPLAASK